MSDGHDVPAIFKRDHRGRFVSVRASVNAWEASLAMAPARDAEHQLRRHLSRIARNGAGNPDRPLVFQEITVCGKRVPDDLSPEDAHAILEGRR